MGILGRVAHGVESSNSTARTPPAPTAGLNPLDISREQQNVAAEARQREARRLRADDAKAAEDEKKFRDTITKLSNLLASGSINTVTIRNEAPDNATVTTRANERATAERYAN